MPWKSIILLTPLIFIACSSHHHEVMKDGDVQPPISSVIKEKINRESIEQHVAQWPKASIEATKFMLNKYGLPSGLTDEMLVWNKVAPFKRSLVHNQEEKVLEEVITYNIDASKTQRLMKFQRDVKIDYKRQELSVYNDHEFENILTLNMADAVMKGRLSPQSAKTKMKSERSGQYSKSLLFLGPKAQLTTTSI